MVIPFAPVRDGSCPGTKLTAGQLEIGAETVRKWSVPVMRANARLGSVFKWEPILHFFCAGFGGGSRNL